MTTKVVPRKEQNYRTETKPGVLSDHTMLCRPGNPYIVLDIKPVIHI